MSDDNYTNPNADINNSYSIAAPNTKDPKFQYIMQNYWHGGIAPTEANAAKIPEQYKDYISYRPATYGKEGEQQQSASWEFKNMPQPGKYQGLEIQSGRDPNAPIPKGARDTMINKSANYYDPNYGWITFSANINQKDTGFKGMLQTASNLSPTIAMAAGTMGLGALGMPSLALAGINAVKGIGEGKKPINVLGQAALGYGLGEAGKMIGGGWQSDLLKGAGKYYGGQLFNNSMIQQRPNLQQLYGQISAPQASMSPGNARMNQGYRPTIRPPVNYNYLQTRGR